MLVAGFAAGGLALFGLMTAGAASAGSYTSGAWTLTAPQTDSYAAQVQQPINPDGSSVWSAKRGVIPVQFKLYDTKSFTFESLLSGYCSPQPCYTPVNDTASSDASYVPASPITVADLTSLVANYTWQSGTDHGGSLRWSIETPDGNIHVYFGDSPSFTTESVTDGSGANLLSLSDARVDTTQFTGGTFYDTWAHASSLSFLGGEPVNAVDLVVDGGWGGDQVLNLTSATVTDSINGGSTFTMPGSTTSQTTAPAMYIDLVQGSASDPGTVDETTYTGVGDTSGQFAVVNGMYKYNLSNNLSAGTYYVYMTPGTDSQRINNPGKFVLK
jgi:hypothetical protein